MKTSSAGIVCLFVCFLNSALCQQPLNGFQLQAECKAAIANFEGKMDKTTITYMRSTAALNYVTGYVEALRAAEIATNQTVIAIPKDATTIQTVRIVSSYLDGHPESLNKGKSVLVFAALLEAYGNKR